jgi:hypothetical protein
MGSMSAEKLVKYCIKHIAKYEELDYDKLKIDSKKVIKMARDYDQQILGLMEDLLDLGNVGSIEELYDFDIEVVKMYCRIKDIDDSVSDRKLVEAVWKNMQEEFELDESESEQGSEPDSEPELVDEPDSDSDEPPPPPPPVKVEQIKKSKKKIQIVE